MPRKNLLAECDQPPLRQPLEGSGWRYLNPKEIVKKGDLVKAIGDYKWRPIELRAYLIGSRVGKNDGETFMRAHPTNL